VTSDTGTLDWVDNGACSVARTLDLVGDRWSVLILREAFWGVRRFEVLQRHLGIARNVLTDRLQRLVGAGILDRLPYSERPPRSEYRLSPAGRDLYPALIALMQWGDKHLPPVEGGPPVVLTHQPCGHAEGFHLACNHCGELVVPNDVRGRIVGITP
jgi:DNA-binding HxlR family transcriptional regulator